MQSMTGFGQASQPYALGTVSVQIAAVNHRSCQVQVKCDIRDLATEEHIRNEVKRVLERGSITVHVRSQAASALAMDKDRLMATWRELAGIAKELGAPCPALEHVAALLPTTAGSGDSGAEVNLKPALAGALAALRHERQREGAIIATAFQEYTQRLQLLVPRMQAAAARRAQAWRDHLRERLQEILGGTSVSDDVLIRELALYSDRIDISEEQLRLAAHLSALEQLIVESDEHMRDGGQGKRLDFLLQEIGREINTTGAKSSDIALTTLVLEAKAIVEQMKEQAANVL